MTTSKVGVVIPARKESSRLPYKMALNIHGKPLIQWTYDNAKKAGYPTWVATNDETLTEYAKVSNVFYVRDDVFTGSDRVAVANRSQLLDYDIVINVQGDCPDIHPDDIVALAEFIQENPADGTMYTMHVDENPVIKFENTYTRFSMERHIGIYGFTKQGLENFYTMPQSDHEKIFSLEQLRGMDIVSIPALYAPHGINTEEDLERFKRAINRFA